MGAGAIALGGVFVFIFFPAFIVKHCSLYYRLQIDKDI